MPFELAGVEISGGRAVVGTRVIATADPARLRVELAETLYDQCHAGRIVADDPADADLRTALTAAVPHRHTRTAVRVRSTTAAGLIVELDGVLVAVPPAPAAVGDVIGVDIDCARPRLSPGFLVVDGSVGTGMSATAPILRLYAHIASAVAAPALWTAVLDVLEARALPYRAKIRCASGGFPRRDALVVYLPPPSVAAVPAIAARLTGAPGIGADVSAFAHRVAPGVALAWQPADDRPGFAGLSFGEHRSLALADGLLATGTDRATAIGAAFRAANIDPHRPFRNLNSPNLTSLTIM